MKTDSVIAKINNPFNSNRNTLSQYKSTLSFNPITVDSVQSNVNVIKPATLFIMSLPLLALIMRLTTFQRRRDGFAEVDGSSMVQILLVGIMAIIVLLSPKGIETVRKSFNGPWLWFWLYSIWSACSALWSSLPVFSLYRSIELAVIAAYSLYLIKSCGTRKQAILLILSITSVYILLDVLRFGNLFLLITRVLHTNSFTCAAAIVLALAIFARKQAGIYSKFFLFFMLLAIWGGTSGGSNVAALLGILTYFFLIKGGKASSLFVALGTLSILAIIITSIQTDTLINVLFPGKTIEGVTSMTGRTRIWEVYWNAFLKEPWLGYGFAVGEKSGQLLGFIYTASAHNMVISLAINTGLIGIGIYSIFIVQILLKTLACLRAEYLGEAAAITGCIVACLTNAMTAPVLGSYFVTPTISILLVLGFAEIFLWRPKRENSNNRNKSNLSSVSAVQSPQIQRLNLFSTHNTNRSSYPGRCSRLS